MPIRGLLALMVKIAHHLWIGMGIVSSIVWLSNHFRVIQLAPSTASFVTHFLACGMLAVIVGKSLMSDRRFRLDCPFLYLRRSIQIAEGRKTGRNTEPLLKRWIASDWTDEQFGWTICLSLLAFWVWTLSLHP